MNSSTHSSCRDRCGDSGRWNCRIRLYLNTCERNSLCFRSTSIHLQIISAKRGYCAERERLEARFDRKLNSRKGKNANQSWKEFLRGLFNNHIPSPLPLMAQGRGGGRGSSRLVAKFFVLTAFGFILPVGAIWVFITNFTVINAGGAAATAKLAWLTESGGRGGWKKESGFEPIIKTVCDSCFLTACESTAVCHNSLTAVVSPHVRESRTVLDSGLHVVDSGLQLLDSSICQ